MNLLCILILLSLWNQLFQIWCVPKIDFPSSIDMLHHIHRLGVHGMQISLLLMNPLFDLLTQFFLVEWIVTCYLVLSYIEPGKSSVFDKCATKNIWSCNRCCHSAPEWRESCPSCRRSSWGALCLHGKMISWPKQIFLVLPLMSYDNGLKNVNWPFEKVC